MDFVNMFATVQNQLNYFNIYSTADRNKFLRMLKRIITAIETGDGELIEKTLLIHFSEPIKWIQEQGFSIEIPFS